MRKTLLLLGLISTGCCSTLPTEAPKTPVQVCRLTKAPPLAPMVRLAGKADGCPEPFAACLEVLDMVALAGYVEDIEAWALTAWSLCSEAPVDDAERPSSQSPGGVSPGTAAPDAGASMREP